MGHQLHPTPCWRELGNSWPTASHLTLSFLSELESIGLDKAKRQEQMEYNNWPDLHL